MDGRKRQFSSGALRPGRLDALGSVAAAAGAVHCALLPLALSVAVLAGVRWIADERLEWAFALISLCIGCSSLVPSYARQHRQRRCLGLFGVGAASLLSARALPEGHPVPELLLAMSGAGLIVSAHVVNQRLCRQCRACDDSAHDRVAPQGRQS